MRAVAVLALLNTGCATLGVAYVTQPFDIRLGEPERKYSREVLETEQIGNEVKESEQDSIVVLDTTGDVIRFRCAVRGVYKTEARERLRVTENLRYRIYNPVADLLEIPATLVDLPAWTCFLCQTLCERRRSPYFNLYPRTKPLTVLGFIGRGIVPGTNIGTHRTDEGKSWEEHRPVWSSRTGEWGPAAGREIEVTVDAITRKLRTDGEGLLVVDLRQWNAQIPLGGWKAIKLHLVRSHRFVFSPALKRVERR